MQDFDKHQAPIC